MLLFCSNLKQDNSKKSLLLFIANVTLLILKFSQKKTTNVKIFNKSEYQLSH